MNETAVAAMTSRLSLKAFLLVGSVQEDKSTSQALVAGHLVRSFAEDFKIAGVMSELFALLS